MDHLKDPILPSVCPGGQPHNRQPFRRLVERPWSGPRYGHGCETLFIGFDPSITDGDIPHLFPLFQNDICAIPLHHCRLDSSTVDVYRGSRMIQTIFLFAQSACDAGTCQVLFGE